jgi:hypothetical protein
VNTDNKTNIMISYFIYDRKTNTKQHIYEAQRSQK